MRSRSLLKTVSTVIVSSFVLQQISFADPASLTSALRLAPFKPVSFPDSVAWIDDRSSGDSGLAVYLIQDAHTNDSAQMNIARAIDAISESGVRTIFLEAGTGDDSLHDLRSLASAEKRREVARSFVLRGEMSGAEYVDLTSERPTRLWGVEDEALYARSVQAFRAVAGKREAYQAALDRAAAAVDSLKGETYSPVLLDWDRARKAWTAGGSLVAYFDALQTAASKAGIELKYYPQLFGMRDLIKLEKSVRFDEAAREQQEALKALTDDEQQALAGDPEAAPHQAAVSDLRRMDAILSVLAEKNDDFRRLPELARYRDYLKSVRALNSSRAVSEIRLLENEIRRKLARTPQEEELLSADEFIGLLSGLVSLTLTPDDYAQYRRLKREEGVAALFGRINARIADQNRDYHRILFWDETFEAFLGKAESFYELTLERDHAFVRNLLSDMRRTGETRTALLTGGYHAPNLKRLLADEGLSVFSVMPQMSKETNLKRYEKILFERARQAEGSATDASKNAVVPIRQAAADYVRLRGFLADRTAVAASRLASEKPRLIDRLLAPWKEGRKYIPIVTSQGSAPAPGAPKETLGQNRPSSIEPPHGHPASQPSEEDIDGARLAGNRSLETLGLLRTLEMGHVLPADVLVQLKKALDTGNRPLTGEEEVVLLESMKAKPTSQTFRINRRLQAGEADKNVAKVSMTDVEVVAAMLNGKVVGVRHNGIEQLVAAKNIDEWLKTYREGVREAEANSADSVANPRSASVPIAGSKWIPRKVAAAVVALGSVVAPGVTPVAVRSMAAQTQTVSVPPALPWTFPGPQMVQPPNGNTGDYNYYRIFVGEKNATVYTVLTSLGTNTVLLTYADGSITGTPYNNWQPITVAWAQQSEYNRMAYQSALDQLLQTIDKGLNDYPDPTYANRQILLFLRSQLVNARARAGLTTPAAPTGAGTYVPGTVQTDFSFSAQAKPGEIALSVSRSGVTLIVQEPRAFAQYATGGNRYEFDLSKIGQYVLVTPDGKRTQVGPAQSSGSASAYSGSFTPILAVFDKAIELARQAGQADAVQRLQAAKTALVDFSHGISAGTFSVDLTTAGLPKSIQQLADGSIQLVFTDYVSGTGNRTWTFRLSAANPYAVQITLSTSAGASSYTLERSKGLSAYLGTVQSILEALDAAFAKTANPAIAQAAQKLRTDSRAGRVFETFQVAGTSHQYGQTVEFSGYKSQIVTIDLSQPDILYVQGYSQDTATAINRNVNAQLYQEKLQYLIDHLSGAPAETMNRLRALLSVSVQPVFSHTWTVSGSAPGSQDIIKIDRTRPAQSSGGARDIVTISRNDINYPDNIVSDFDVNTGSITVKAKGGFTVTYPANSGSAYQNNLQALMGIVQRALAQTNLDGQTRQNLQWVLARLQERVYVPAAGDFTYQAPGRSTGLVIDISLRSTIAQVGETPAPPSSHGTASFEVDLTTGKITLYRLNQLPVVYDKTSPDYQEKLQSVIDMVDAALADAVRTHAPATVREGLSRLKAALLVIQAGAPIVHTLNLPLYNMTTTLTADSGSISVVNVITGSPSSNELRFDRSTGTISWKVFYNGNQVGSTETYTRNTPGYFFYFSVLVKDLILDLVHARVNNLPDRTAAVRTLLATLKPFALVESSATHLKGSSLEEPVDYVEVLDSGADGVALYSYANVVSGQFAMGRDFYDFPAYHRYVPETKKIYSTNQGQEPLKYGDADYARAVQAGIDTLNRALSVARSNASNPLYPTNPAVIALIEKRIQDLRGMLLPPGAFPAFSQSFTLGGTPYAVVSEAGKVVIGNPDVYILDYTIAADGSITIEGYKTGVTIRPGENVGGYQSAAFRYAQVIKDLLSRLQYAAEKAPTPAEAANFRALVEALRKFDTAPAGTEFRVLLSSTAAGTTFENLISATDDGRITFGQNSSAGTAVNVWSVVLQPNGDIIDYSGTSPKTYAKGSLEYAAAFERMFQVVQTLLDQGVLSYYNKDLAAVKAKLLQLNPNAGIPGTETILASQGDVAVYTMERQPVSVQTSGTSGTGMGVALASKPRDVLVLKRISTGERIGGEITLGNYYAASVERADFTPDGRHVTVRYSIRSGYAVVQSVLVIDTATGLPKIDIGQMFNLGEIQSVALENGRVTIGSNVYLPGSTTQTAVSQTFVFGDVTGLVIATLADGRPVAYTKKLTYTSSGGTYHGVSEYLEFRDASGTPRRVKVNEAGFTGYSSDIRDVKGISEVKTTFDSKTISVLTAQTLFGIGGPAAVANNILAINTRTGNIEVDFQQAIGNPNNGVHIDAYTVDSGTVSVTFRRIISDNVHYTFHLSDAVETKTITWNPDGARLAGEITRRHWIAGVLLGASAAEAQSQSSIRNPRRLPPGVSADFNITLPSTPAQQGATLVRKGSVLTVVTNSASAPERITIDLSAPGTIRVEIRGEYQSYESLIRPLEYYRFVNRLIGYLDAALQISGRHYGLGVTRNALRAIDPDFSVTSADGTFTAQKKGTALTTSIVGPLSVQNSVVDLNFVDAVVNSSRAGTFTFNPIDQPEGFLNTMNDIALALRRTGDARAIRLADRLDVIVVVYFQYQGASPTAGNVVDIIRQGVDDLTVADTGATPSSHLSSFYRINLRTGEIVLNSRQSVHTLEGGERDTALSLLVDWTRFSLTLAKNNLEKLRLDQVLTDLSRLAMNRAGARLANATHIEVERSHPARIQTDLVQLAQNEIRTVEEASKSPFALLNVGKGPYGFTFTAGPDSLSVLVNSSNDVRLNMFRNHQIDLGSFEFSRSSVKDLRSGATRQMAEPLKSIEYEKGRFTIRLSQEALLFVQSGYRGRDFGVDFVEYAGARLASAKPAEGVRPVSPLVGQVATREQIQESAAALYAKAPKFILYVNGVYEWESDRALPVETAKADLAGRLAQERYRVNILEERDGSTLLGLTPVSAARLAEQPQETPWITLTALEEILRKPDTSIQPQPVSNDALPYLRHVLVETPEQKLALTQWLNPKGRPAIDVRRAGSAKVELERNVPGLERPEESKEGQQARANVETYDRISELLDRHYQSRAAARLAETVPFTEPGEPRATSTARLLLRPIDIPQAEALTADEIERIVNIVVRAVLAEGGSFSRIVPLLAASGVVLAKSGPEGRGISITIRTLDGRTLNAAPIVVEDLQTHERRTRQEALPNGTAKQRAREMVAFAKMELLNAQMATPVKLGEAAPDAFELDLGSHAKVEDLARFEAKIVWEVAIANKFLGGVKAKHPDFEVYLSDSENKLSAEQREIVDRVLSDLGAANRGIRASSVPASKTLVVRAWHKSALTSRVRDDHSVYLPVDDSDDDSLESWSWLLQYGFSLGQVFAKHIDGGAIDYDRLIAEEADNLRGAYLQAYNGRLSADKIGDGQIREFFELVSGRRADLFVRFALQLMSIQKIDFSAQIAGARMAMAIIGRAA